MLIHELLRDLKECDQALPVVLPDGSPIKATTLTYGADGTFAYVLSDGPLNAANTDDAIAKLAERGFVLGEP